jgi:hypothetical protein
VSAKFVARATPVNGFTVSSRDVGVHVCCSYADQANDGKAANAQQTLELPVATLAFQARRSKRCA